MPSAYGIYFYKPMCNSVGDMVYVMSVTFTFPRLFLVSILDWTDAGVQVNVLIFFLNAPCYGIKPHDLVMSPGSQTSMPLCH